MSLLSPTQNCALRMRPECWERFPRHRLQRKPLFSDPDMHHGRCAMHVPRCMSRSLTHGGGENVTGIPGACATCNFAHLVRGHRHLYMSMFHRTFGNGAWWALLSLLYWYPIFLLSRSNSLEYQVPVDKIHLIFNIKRDAGTSQKYISRNWVIYIHIYVNYSNVELKKLSNDGKSNYWSLPYIGFGRSQIWLMICIIDCWWFA